MKRKVKMLSFDDDITMHTLICALDSHKEKLERIGRDGVTGTVQMRIVQQLRSALTLDKDFIIAIRTSLTEEG